MAVETAALFSYMITRNGIVYDLRLSPYYIKLDKTTYYFSSKNHLEKFNEKLYVHRMAIRTSLTNRFGIDVNITLLADLVLYTKVETRGFYITPYTCRKDITLDGATLTEKL